MTDSKPPSSNSTQHRGAQEDDDLRIAEWLRREAPPLEEWYREALFMIAGNLSQVRLRIVCHCVREIGNRLPDIILGGSAGYTDYPALFDELAHLWPNHAGTPLNPSEDAGDVTISRNKYTAISEIFDQHHAARSRPLDLSIRLFQNLDPLRRSTHEAITRTAREWRKLLSWCAGRAHQPAKNEMRVEEEEFLGYWRSFRQFLVILSTGFFKLEGELRNVLDAANQRPD